MCSERLYWPLGLHHFRKKGYKEQLFYDMYQTIVFDINGFNGLFWKCHQSNKHVNNSCFGKVVTPVVIAMFVLEMFVVNCFIMFFEMY